MWAAQWATSATFVHILSGVQQPKAVFAQPDGVLMLMQLLEGLASCGGKTG